MTASPTPDPQPRAVVHSYALGPLQTNAFLCSLDRDAVAIDPGDDPHRLVEQLHHDNARLRAILLTHAHFDHIGGVDALRRETGAPVYVHEAEADHLANPGKNLSMLLGMDVVARPAEETVSDGQTLTFGALSFEVRHVPGHSPGGVGYYAAAHNVCFCGDAVFAGSVGRTDFPGASHDTLVQAIARQLLTLPDDTVLYPGHGPATTVGEEREHNPYLNAAQES